MDSIATTFKQVVNCVWENSPPKGWHSESCPDRFEGLMSEQKGLAEFPHKDIDQCYKTDDGTNSEGLNLVVILESPHIEEFNGRQGPASGRTGKIIRKYIDDYFHNELGRCKLALVNVIQYQCSAGHLRDQKDRARKNRIVQLMFQKENVIKDFRERIGKFNIKKDVFLLACGKGNSYVHFDQKVLKELNKIGVKNVVAWGYHPSRWPSPWKNSIRYNKLKKLVEDMQEHKDTMSFDKALANKGES